MKTAKFLLIAGMLLAVLSCGQQTTLPLTTPIPARPAGATDVLGLRCDPIDTVRVAVIGLGMRGSDVPKRFIHIPGTRITALCDMLEENVAASAKVVTDAGFPAPACYSGSEDAWKQACERDDVDLVYICTDWVHHTPMALYAMEHGKHTAIEVPAATTLEECWALVNTSERTRKHCMMLENCVYDFFELTALQMAREGLFGEIIHVEGAYNHNLDPFWGRYWNNWRLAFNQQHRGDVYPTHGIGPVCQVLDIHRSDRILIILRHLLRRLRPAVLSGRHVLRVILLRLVLRDIGAQLQQTVPVQPLALQPLFERRHACRAQILPHDLRCHLPDV